MCNDIAFLLELKDQNIEITGHEPHYVLKNDLHVFMFHGKLVETIHHCPYCHQSAQDYQIVKNGTRTSEIKLLDVSGRPTYLALKKQRYYCKACHGSFTAKTPLVERHCFISKRVKRWIADQLTKTISEKDIAELAHVSVHTVRRVTKKEGAALTPTTFDHLPKHLCFDEFKSVNQVNANMSFIMCDAKTHRLVDIVHDRRQAVLVDYFLQYPLEVRRQVETITIDMFDPYIELIKRVFPRTKIIIDKFHLIQAVFRELDRCRIQVMNAYRNTHRRLYNKLKRYHKLFHLPRHKLVYTQYTKFPLFDWWTHTGGIMDYLLSHDDTLKQTYDIAHQLREAMETLDYDRFNEAILCGLSLPVFQGLKRVLRTFQRLLPYIQNTFDYPQYTNGPIEGIVNKIKVLKRQAYGYRSYTHFKARIMLMMKLYIREPHKKSPSIPTQSVHSG